MQYRIYPLIAGALLLAVDLMPQGAQAQTFCLTDGFGKAWTTTLSNNFLTGTMVDNAPFTWDVAGARGNTGRTVRHHQMTALNPNRGADPGCGDGAGFVDWFSYNGRVSPAGGGTYSYSGNWINSCAASGTFTGTFAGGACPAPRSSPIPANDPSLSTTPKFDAAVSTVGNEAARITAYPNPVAQVATISYEIPEAANVRVSVYDVLGREVAVLVDEAQEAGTHTVGFEARTLPAGTYVYHVAAGTYSASERLVITH